MVYFCKGGFSILNIYHTVCVYVENDDENWNSYPNEEINDIANKSLIKSHVIETLFDIDQRYFGDVCVSVDDLYKGNLNERYWTINKNWNYRKILTLFPNEVEYNGKKYNTVISIDREWFDDEEKQN